MPEWLRIVLAVFACFRLSELITVDDGPGDVLLKMRAALGGYDMGENGQPLTSLGKGIICPYCVGIWIAALMALILWPISWATILYWLAVAGGQAFLQGIGGRV